MLLLSLLARAFLERSLLKSVAVVVDGTRVRRQRQEEQEHGREERLKKQVLIITVR